MTPPDLAGKALQEFEAEGRHVVFRYPREDDLDQFVVVHATLARQKVMCSRRTFTHETGLTRIREMLRALNAGERSDIMIEVDGSLCGYGHAQPSGYRYCTVGLAMVADVRGIGIGTALMQLLEEESRRLGGERLYLDVWSANPAAIRVYTKLGYREVGRRPGWIRLDSGDEADLIEMVKRLT